MDFNYVSERNFYREGSPVIEKAKIMVAVLLTLASVFLFAEKLVAIIGGAPDEKIKATVAFVFVVIGLLVFVD